MNNDLNTIDLSSHLLMNFVENDNKKIVLCVKKLYNFYNKYLYKRKQRYFYEFYNNLTNLLYSKNSMIKNKNNNNNNIFNRLFNCSLMKQFYLRGLENKLSQNEEKIYTFSPKTNKGKIKCRFSQNNKNNHLIINKNNHRFNFSFKSNNINSNKINDNNQILFSKEQSTKSKSNQIFHQNNNSFNGENAKNNKLLKRKNSVYNLKNKLDLNIVDNCVVKKNLINNDYLFK